MENRRIEFYKNLIISDEDKVRAELFLDSKGVEKHIIIKEKLFNWIDGDTIEYPLIASTYRYDKRLRIILFKYISYLEEFYRSIILDEYRFNVEQKSLWVKELKEKLKEYNNDLNDALEHIDFFTLLKQVKKLPKQLRNKCLFVKTNKINENMHALKSLRNAVMHNKFLLLYLGYETCYVKGVDGGMGSSLRANIINLLNFLPKDVSESCLKEINNAKNKKENEQGTRWLLPDFIVLEF